MLNKLFIALLAVSSVVMVFFTFYSWSWLGSIGAPEGAVAGYQYHSGLAWPILWVSASILLIVANSILWTTGRLWPMWTTQLYFQVFVVIRAFWLDPALLSFKNAAGMTDSTFTVGPILAAVLIVLAGAIVFFDQFLVLRLKQKTYGVDDPEINEKEEFDVDTERTDIENPRSN